MRVNHNQLLAIDPGTTESGICYIDMLTYEPTGFAKIGNYVLLARIENHMLPWPEHMAIEMIASYGMPVGKEVFDTCVWIGRFIEAASGTSTHIEYVYRQEEKLTICHSNKAGDANIRQALVDRFAPGVPNYGKGTKKEPGWFYGFSKDVWQSYAVGVTYIDKHKEAL